MEFVVRNIPASTGLDGAFRVHLPPELIQQAGLTFNEPCRIVVDGKAVGCGISWRAADKMGASPKIKPARMSETMRDAFGIKEGGQVMLEPTQSKIDHADRIVLTDVTSSPTDNGVEDRRWRSRCKTTLCNAEAVASGMSFDVVAKKGLKKRFCVERIIASTTQQGQAHLYYVTDDTELVFPNGNDSGPPSPEMVTNGHNAIAISTEGIGGLLEQIESLNKSIRLVLQQQTQELSPMNRLNRAVILHGYEGTGKSMLLSRLERTGFRKTLHLNAQDLDATTSKSKATISEVFKDARSHQPSLILMDDLHRSTPASEDKAYRHLLCEELDRISGLRVLVVAASRSMQEVHSELLCAGRFIKSIELPIPDLNARKQVLNALLSGSAEPIKADLASLALRTHGFTCGDLAMLADVAGGHVLERLQGGTLSSQTNGLSTNGVNELDGPTDGMNRADVARLCNEEDLAFALTQVRPAALREIFFETPKVRWSDIGGSQPVQARLDEIIGWPLNHPDLMKQYNLPAQKGMLLYGPPGCSKTLTAQAVAANFEMNFIAVKGAELISMYVGESERAVREIFRKARTAKPCIIFFDEIDSIASEREAAGTKGLNVLTTLLNEMDGFESLDGVFVLAATNKPEVLDPAIMRPGRFDQHLYIAPPNEAARKDIVELHLSSMAREDDLDISRLVKSTDGYTGAEVVAVCNLAKQVAARRLLIGQGGTIRMADFEKALTETPPRITREMLAEYEAFGNR